MQTLTETLISSQLRNHVISEGQLQRLVGGNPGRRYGLVNRAIKAGELLGLKRGLYVLANPFRDFPAHPFATAHSLLPGSYVSFESALSYHGWIPESVPNVACVTPGRKSKQFETKLHGMMSYHPLATRKGYFLELVNRVEEDKQVFLIAKPVRALMDLICLRKLPWQGFEWLVESLRIDSEHLRSINGNDIRILQNVYTQKAMIGYLHQLARALEHD